MGNAADLLILEDHPLVAKITREVVFSCSAEVSIHICGSLSELNSQAELEPKAVILDLGLPDATGLTALDVVTKRFPDAFLLVFTADESLATCSEVLEAGYELVGKRAQPSVLFERVAQLLQDAGLLSDEHNPLQVLGEKNQYQSEIIARGGSKPLTNKQVLIMECCSSGLSAKETARALGMSLDTVRKHMTEIFSRLGAKNNAQAVELYFQAKKDAELRSNSV
ncbi:LuxR C-terminal-related transcriptional regulator [Limnobacter sp.]|uniref:response regulator transcription factor n=1 Tax=Limnobacter sp. TaxID=2003368 RepID=UPI003513A473